MKKLAFILLLSSYGVSAQSLSKPELAVMATVQKQIPETEAFLEKVVNINSGPDASQKRLTTLKIFQPFHR